MAETIRLQTDVPGVGRAGDFVMYDPSNRDPSLRVVVVSPRPESQLPAIREAVQRANELKPPGRAYTPPETPHLSLVED